MANEEIFEVCKTYSEYKEMKKDIDKVLKELEGKLLLAMKERNTNKLQSGAYKVSLAVCNRTTLDSKAIKESYPDVFAEFSKVTQYNRFTVS